MSRRYTEQDVRAAPFPASPLFIDQTGKVHGSLKVLAFAGKHGKPGRKRFNRWWCQCMTCGRIVCILSTYLYRLNRLKKQACAHDHGTKAYIAWQRMRKSGLPVAERWLDFHAFFADMGEKPGDASCGLERIDQAQPYGPGNCRWGKRNSIARSRLRFITFNGRTQTVKERCDEFGLRYSTIMMRIRPKPVGLGWTPEQALSTPRRNAGRYPAAS